MSEGFGIPTALQKAMQDPFDYALGLRSGKIFYFEFASLSDGGLWVHLQGNQQPYYADEEMTEQIRLPDRGVDVRLSDIEWVADMGHE